MSRRIMFLALLVVSVAVLGLGVVGYLLGLRDPRSNQLFNWWRAGGDLRTSLVTVRRQACPGAPFILPSDGFIGLLYADPRGPYSTDRPHQGIDIFSDSEPGVTPVYAAYDGYVTRQAGWKSTLIQRVPQDPLHSGRQIWLYYTHMADESGETDYIEPAFAPGTKELFVEQGTLLGYTGNYSGSPARTVWTHLHFSIVLDDGNGNYRNELEFANTLNPSPYLGMDVNYETAASEAPIGCAAG